MKAPATEREALAQLADDLRRDRHPAAAAIVDAGHRALAGSVVEELPLADRVTRAMVRAWGAGHDAAVLAAYRSLHAPETDGDEDVALAVMGATPPSAERLAAAGAILDEIAQAYAALGAPPVVAIPDDFNALAQYELAFHCRAVGLDEAARLAARAATPAEWLAVRDALCESVVALDDEERRDHAQIGATLIARGRLEPAIMQLARLARVSAETWLSTTRTMLADDATATAGAAS